MDELIYNCPFCSKSVSVNASLLGHNVVCPHCVQEFYATPPEQAAAEAQEKIPFFKFSRRKVLKSELNRLTADGEYSDADHESLTMMASRLGLKDDEIDRLRLKEIEEAVKPLKARIYQTAHLTDEDLEFLSALGRKFRVSIAQESALRMCRDIYLMEAKGENPLVPIQRPQLMLEQGEFLYFSIPCTWGQLRSKVAGYSGISMSIPTGVRGVRVRLGQLNAIRSEELTRLAQGELHITSKRLLFNGDRRNTTIGLGRIIGTSLFSDALEIEKSTGRSDYFFMTALYGRYVGAVVALLKGRG